MKKQKNSRQSKTPTHPYARIQWSSLSDTQKTHLLLGGTRMMDTELFAIEYGSFESPVNNNLKLRATV